MTITNDEVVLEKLAVMLREIIQEEVKQAIADHHYVFQGIVLTEFDRLRSEGKR